MATAAQVAEFRQANQSLVLLAQRDIREFWASLNLAGDPSRIRNLVLDFFPEVITAYGDTAAVLGSDWYELLRDAPASTRAFDAVLAEPLPVEQAQQSARWALGPLFQENPDGALALLSGATQRLVLQPGRDSVFRSALKDPLKVRFARIPRGAKTCRFCTMVASRGFVYATASNAGQSNQWHDDCDCVILPGRSESDFPDGHDVEAFRAAYKSGSGIGHDIPTD